jgi:diguanylate cyclase (GGDEF)-like protein/PAS domain S-box-containing protein
MVTDQSKVERSPAERASRTPRDPAVPLQVYASLVDALYEVAVPLFIGSAAGSIAAGITAWQAGSWQLLVFAIVLALVAGLRAWDMGNYSRLRSTLRTEAAFRKWERRYVVGAALYVGMFGTWCLACFLVTDDAFVRLFGFSSVIAYMVGTSGRNFASRSLVVTQLIGGGLPLSLALFSVGGVYYSIFVIVLLPFFFGLKTISDRLRKVLLDAIISARDITQLAARFTTALNNMPHGLVMFDSERRLLVANERFVELMRLPTKSEVAGRLSREVLLASGAFSRIADSRRFVTEFERRLFRTQGELTAETGDGRWLSFTTRPMENGGSVVIVEDVTERRSAEQRIDRMARFDALTSLPNRNHLHEQLERTLASLEDDMARLAVLFVDLDEFKQVNDTLGHPSGDQLLCAVADRLLAVVSTNEMVARFGGDEFVILQRQQQAVDDRAEELARIIVGSLSQPYEIDGHDIIIGASIGIAYAPRDGSDPDLLLKNADMALYHAKAGGKGGVRVFDSSMDAEAHAKRALELDVRQALAANQLELYYQPLLDLKTMSVRTCEALLRWRHPERGMVPPNEFIPVAENIGIITEMGQWVLEEACRECATWPSEVSVAVNLSPVQFRQPGLPAMVTQAARAAGLPPERLEVEITESVLLKDTPTVRAMLEELVQSGIRISLDDFGTGYSGLSYLQTFPLNKVKIDRSFVTELHSGDRSLTLLRGMARLSAALGLKVVVEGIETTDQLEIIAAEGTVDEAQGYVFSVPLPAKQVRELIASQSQSAVPGRLRHHGGGRASGGLA